jgi:hypothetical protein
MVDWAGLIVLLKNNHYSGDYALEDFLVPNSSKAAAIAYLNWVQSEFSRLYQHYNALAEPQSLAMALAPI